MIDWYKFTRNCAALQLRNLRKQRDQYQKWIEQNVDPKCVQWKQEVIARIEAVREDNRIKGIY